MDPATEKDGTSPRADLWGGIVWIVVGLAIFWGSWTMDRLPHFHIQFYTVPGLLPGILGIAIALMGAILLGRAIRAGALQSVVPPRFAAADHWRLAFTLGWSVCYAAVVMAALAPFWLATAAYVAVFVIVFQYEERRASGKLPRGLVVALAHGLLSGLIIQYVFEDLFLVRLP